MSHVEPDQRNLLIAALAVFVGCLTAAFGASSLFTTGKVSLDVLVQLTVASMQFALAALFALPTLRHRARKVTRIVVTSTGLVGLSLSLYGLNLIPGSDAWRIAFSVLLASLTFLGMWLGFYLYSRRHVRRQGNRS